MESDVKKGVSPVVLLLAVLLSVATAAAVTLALRPAPSVAPVVMVDGKPVPAEAVPIAAAFTQTDTVAPGSKFTGQIFYPIPYSSPPNFKINPSDKKRTYETIKEDEFGFVWVIRPNVEDFSEEMQKAQKPEALAKYLFDTYDADRYKPNLKFADFTWEAKGVRGSGTPTKPFEQTGTFQTLADTDGEVVFPIPYAGPANVELSGNGSQYVIVVEARANGFKWKNKPDPTWKSFANGTITWKSRGVRAEK